MLFLDSLLDSFIDEKSVATATFSHSFACCLSSVRIDISLTHSFVHSFTMVYEYEAELDEIDEEREHAAKAAADAAALSSSTDAASAAATNNLTTLDDKSLSSAPRSLANVIKSYTGAGVLGLPYGRVSRTTSWR